MIDDEELEPKKETTSRFGAICSCFSRKKNTAVENDDENELLPEGEDGESEEEADENASSKKAGSQAGLNSQANEQEQLPEQIENEATE